MLTQDIIMAEQKARKLETIKEKTEVACLTDKLDAEYKNLFHNVGKSSSSSTAASLLMERTGTVKKVVEDYDKLVRELIFEPRGVVTHAVNTESDKTQETNDANGMDKDMDEKMPKNNENSAVIDDENLSKSKLRSVEGIDDNRVRKRRKEEDVNTLRYDKDGKCYCYCTILFY